MIKSKKIKTSWGGKRPGSGAKKKEETETTGFRINSEALNICRAAYGRTLNKHVNDFVKRLAKKSNIVYLESERFDAEKFLNDKDIWNHPIITDRTEKNSYEVADLMSDFANYYAAKGNA